MECEILVIAEHTRGELDPITYDLISCAANIGQQRKWRVGVLVVGFALKEMVEQLKRSAGDFVLTADDSELENHNAPAYTRIAVRAGFRVSARFILLAHTTATDCSLLPGITGELNASLHQ